MRNLERRLNNTILKYRFFVKCLPGAKLDRIMLTAMANLSYYDDISMVILLGGINNITQVKRTPQWHATLRYQNREEICDVLMQEYYRVTDRIMAISNVPVVVATLPGMNLATYAPMLERRLTPLQPILDGAIVEINRRIRGLNRIRNLNTPDLAYPVHRCVGRRGR